MSVQIITLDSNLFLENGYIIYDDQSAKKECIFIDPGMQPQKFIDYMDEHGLTPVAILCTHGHADHIAGIAPLKEKFPEISIIIGEKDAEKLINPQGNRSLLYGFPFTVPSADRVLFQDGGEVEMISLAGLEIEARHTPGHSAGHSIFWVKGVEPLALIVGDLIFERGVGQFLEEKNSSVLFNSIRRHVYSFPDETVLYPGHGNTTTVGSEKRLNPSVREEKYRDS